MSKWKALAEAGDPTGGFEGLGELVKAVELGAGGSELGAAAGMPLRAAAAAVGDAKASPELVS